MSNGWIAEIEARVHKEEIIARGKKSGTTQSYRWIEDRLGLDEGELKDGEKAEEIA